ncbi:MAG TPA: FAD/NAD(P)-binding protein [Allosphingosinicella sp.]
MAEVVAVVGGGYSGTIAAAELARTGVQTVLIERSGSFAAGAAYGTAEPAHLLNVRAQNMSAFAAECDHFSTWVENEGLGDGETFVPRREYHRYLAHILEAAVRTGRVELLNGDVLAADGGHLLLAGGQRLPCRAAVLAGGNYPSRLPVFLRGPDAVENPWGPEGAVALKRLAKQDGDILLLGTGLTMVDVALTLSNAGFPGRMIATSRRGLVPRPHEQPGVKPLPAPPPGSLREMTRDLRAAAEAGGWRAAVDSLRPVAQSLWMGLSEPEKRRFLRHLRPWWDVHRHRIAPPVAARIAALQREGRLEILPGRISGFQADTVSIACRGGGSEVRRQVSGVVNCTGPEGAIGRVDDPLIRHLLSSGQARADSLGIGLDVDCASRVMGADGAASTRLYAVGPLTRGIFWEIVAVPNIREQARDVAEAIAAY